MKRLLLVSLWAGFATYCLLGLVFGPSGVMAMRHAEKSAGAMAQAISVLSARNNELASQWEWLENDPDATALEARSLGYLADSETAVRIVAATPRPEIPVVGERLTYVPRVALDVQAITHIALAVAFSVMIAGMALLAYGKMKAGAGFSGKPSSTPLP